MAKTIKKKKYPFIILPNQPEYGKKGQYLYEENVGLETTDIRDDLVSTSEDIVTEGFFHAYGPGAFSIEQLPIIYTTNDNASGNNEYPGAEDLTIEAYFMDDSNVTGLRANQYDSSGKPTTPIYTDENGLQGYYNLRTQTRIAIENYAIWGGGTRPTDGNPIISPWTAPTESDADMLMAWFLGNGQAQEWDTLGQKPADMLETFYESFDNSPKIMIPQVDTGGPARHLIWRFATDKNHGPHGVVMDYAAPDFHNGLGWNYQGNPTNDSGDPTYTLPTPSQNGYGMADANGPHFENHIVDWSKDISLGEIDKHYLEQGSEALTLQQERRKQRWRYASAMDHGEYHMMQPGRLFDVLYLDNFPYPTNPFAPDFVLKSMETRFAAYQNITHTNIYHQMDCSTADCSSFRNYSDGLFNKFLSRFQWRRNYPTSLTEFNWSIGILDNDNEDPLTIDNPNAHRDPEEYEAGNTTGYKTEDYMFIYHYDEPDTSISQNTEAFCNVFNSYPNACDELSLINVCTYNTVNQTCSANLNAPTTAPYCKYLVGHYGSTEYTGGFISALKSIYTNRFREDFNTTGQTAYILWNNDDPAQGVNFDAIDEEGDFYKLWSICDGDNWPLGSGSGFHSNPLWYMDDDIWDVNVTSGYDFGDSRARPRFSGQMLGHTKFDFNKETHFAEGYWYGDKHKPGGNSTFPGAEAYYTYEAVPWFDPQDLKSTDTVINVEEFYNVEKNYNDSAFWFILQNNHRLNAEGNIHEAVQAFRLPKYVWYDAWYDNTEKEIWFACTYRLLSDLPALYTEETNYFGGDHMLIDHTDNEMMRVGTDFEQNPEIWTDGDGNSYTLDAFDENKDNKYIFPCPPRFSEKDDGETTNGLTPFGWVKFKISPPKDIGDVTKDKYYEQYIGRSHGFVTENDISDYYRFSPSKGASIYNLTGTGLTLEDLFDAGGGDSSQNYFRPVGFVYTGGYKDDTTNFVQKYYELDSKSFFETSVPNNVKIHIGITDTDRPDKRYIANPNESTVGYKFAIARWGDEGNISTDAELIDEISLFEDNPMLMAQLQREDKYIWTEIDGLMKTQEHVYTQPGGKTIKAFVIKYIKNLEAGFIQSIGWRLCTIKINLNVDEAYIEDFSDIGGIDFKFIPWRKTAPIIGGISQESNYYKSIQTIKDENKFSSNEIIDLEYVLNDNMDEMGKHIGQLDLQQTRYFDTPKTLSDLLMIDVTAELDGSTTLVKPKPENIGDDNYWDGLDNSFPVESCVGSIFINDNSSLELKQACKFEFNFGSTDGDSILDTSGNSNKGLLISDYSLVKEDVDIPVTREDTPEFPEVDTENGAI